MNYQELYENILNIKSIGAALDDDTLLIGNNGARAFRSMLRRKCERLWELFGTGGIPPKPFIESYNEATSGKGFEERRITQLNSSSLLALLCFWRVSEKFPITIEGIKYTKVFFEVENMVFDNNSSIDLLLVSEDGNTLLFLESKFTETLNPRRGYWLSEKYYQVYKAIESLLAPEISIGNIETKTRKSGAQNEFVINSPDGGKHYFGGIKQMISHLLGLLQGPNTVSKSERIPHISYYKDRSKKLILGTILFNFSEGNFKSAYQDYVSLYSCVFTESNVRKIIKTITNLADSAITARRTDIKVLTRPITYQEVFESQTNRNSICHKVATFYRLIGL